eukprot:UN09134
MFYIKISLFSQEKKF